MGHTFVDVSVKGRWSTVPALRVGEVSIIANGRWVTVARIHDEPWLPREVDDPERCIQALKRFGVGGRRPDIFTFAQTVADTTPRYRHPLEWESIATVRLSTYATWWARLPDDVRRNVKRAGKRGVLARVRALDDNLVAGIVEVNNESRVRQGAPCIHFGKTHAEVARDQAVHLERSEFLCAYLGDELIGFLKIVYGDRCGVFVQFLTKRSRRALKPANALVAKAVERCCENGLRYMVYGKYRYGNQPDTSLMEFKRRNGFEEILVPRYYVPLTTRGRVAMALGLHRDRVDTLPEGAISVGRRARAAWYALRTANDGR